MLGVRGADIDWGDQLIRVHRKGSGAQQWLPASPEAFVWLRLYHTEIGQIGPNERLWKTLRRRRRNGGPPEPPRSGLRLPARRPRASQQFARCQLVDARPAAATRNPLDSAHPLRLCAGRLAIVGPGHLRTRMALATGRLPVEAVYPGRRTWPDLRPGLEVPLTARRQQLATLLREKGTT
ncbi:hypothetical protein [Nonomuraea angiospora]|uniref:hypothetical protein n=1 Tax=Nonomuraea angiospora TaxID=46172 RepID=UPI003B5A85EF